MARDLLVGARRLTKSFGETRALRSIDIDLYRGEVHALLGGNGAGKSTLISILEGVTTPDGGDLDIRAHGIAVVHQELALMPDLTVAENIEMPFQGGLGYRWRRSAVRSTAALALLGETGAGIDPAVRVAQLPLHLRQLVEIARALRSGAELILLDEPTASLTAAETDRLFEVVRRLASQGIGVVIVSHRMHEIRQVADVATIFRDGRTVIHSTPLESLTDARIVTEMFGSALDHGRADAGAPRARVTSEVTRISLRHAPSGLVADVRAGAVLGLAGAPGGPVALMDAILGARRSRTWELNVDGIPWRPRSPRAAITAGIGYVSGDRSGKGVFPDLTIDENAVLAEQVVRRRFFRTSRESDAVGRRARDLGFSHVDLGDKPGSLSGGTLQKVLIARWLDVPLKVLVLEEPTRGVDVKTKGELYDIVRRLTETGIAVVWWSTEASELLAVADDILAFTVEGLPTSLRPAASSDEAALVAETGTAA